LILTDAPGRRKAGGTLSAVFRGVWTDTGKVEDHASVRF